MLVALASLGALLCAAEDKQGEAVPAVAETFYRRVSVLFAVSNVRFCAQGLPQPVACLQLFKLPMPEQAHESRLLTAPLKATTKQFIDR
jgi:hypothetical protein